MHVGPVDTQLALLQRLFDAPAAPATHMAQHVLGEALAEARSSQVHAVMITPPATSVQMLVAIAAATPEVDRRRLAVEAERGSIDRLRRQQARRRPGPEPVGTIAALGHHPHDAEASPLDREADLRFLAALAEPKREI